jgi:hypothetical protein
MSKVILVQDDEQHKTIKMMSIERDMEMNEFINKFFDIYLKVEKKEKQVKK